jgi:hypothetical protein
MGCLLKSPLIGPGTSLALQPLRSHATEQNCCFRGRIVAAPRLHAPVSPGNPLLLSLLPVRLPSCSTRATRVDKLRYNIRANSRLALSRRQYQSAALSVHLLHRFRRQFHALMPFPSWTSQACFCALLLTYHMPTETRHATGANALRRDIVLPGFDKIATETARRSML